MKIPKIGIFFPWRENFHSRWSIHNWWVWRIDKRTQETLELYLDQEDNIEFKYNLNFRDAVIVNNQVLLGWFCMNELDAYFWYCEVDRSIWSYDLDILKTLAKTTHVFPNPYKFEVWLDKFHSHTLVSSQGVKVADTILFSKETLKNTKLTIDEWWGWVLKPRRGGFWKWVMFIRSYEELRDMVDYIASENWNSKNDAYMLERYYPNDLEKWVSITLIGGKIMYWYRKRKTKRVPFWNGAEKIYDEWEVWWEVDRCSITLEQEKMAIDAYNAMWMGIIWFDFIVTTEGTPILIDENTFPWFYRDIFNEIWLDPAKELYTYITRTIKSLENLVWDYQARGEGLYKKSPLLLNFATDNRTTSDGKWTIISRQTVA